MKGARPEQAVLSRDTDLGKTPQTRAVIEAMVDGLNDHRIDDIGQFFADGFRWMGNQGCGTKLGLKAFQDNWQRPFQAAFSDKVCIDEARLFMGEWAAAFGRQEATHSGRFMGVAPTGQRVEIRYMDFWKVVDGKIVDNWVSVDFAHVLAQLGVDVFKGEGWEAFDRGARVPPAPETEPVSDPKSDTDFGAGAMVAASRLQGRGWQGDRARLLAGLPETGRALHVGCGEGQFCREMVARGLVCTGLDPSPALIRYAQATDPTGAYVTGNPAALPFDGRSFDAVILDLPAIAAPDLRAVAAEAARVLCSGGRVLALIDPAQPPAIADCMTALLGAGLRLTVFEEAANPGPEDHPPCNALPPPVFTAWETSREQP